MKKTIKPKYIYYTIGFFLFVSIITVFWLSLNLYKFESLFNSKLQQEMVSFVFRDINILLFLTTIGILILCLALALSQAISSYKEKNLARMPNIGIILSISFVLAAVYTFFNWNTFQDIQSYRQGKLITKEVQIASCERKGLAKYDKSRRFPPLKPAYNEFITKENKAFMNYHSCLDINEGAKYKLTLLPKNKYILKLEPVKD